MNNAESGVAAAPDDGAPTFSPIENEPPLRWQRALHLAPRKGLGVARRAVIFTMLAWLPLAIWAALMHRLWEGPPGEALLQHFGVHVRCLIAIPLLVVAEATLHNGLSKLIPQFLLSGIVAPSARHRFERILHDVSRLRDTTLPWILVLGIALAWTLGDAPDPQADEMSWALGTDGRLGFGGFWLAYVARPIFVALLLGWLWRLALVISQSVAAICLWGTLVGSMLPLVFKRFGVDPGIASSPFVATFVDVTGTIIYFSLATVLLL